MPPAVVLPNQKRQPRLLLDIATPLPPVEGNGNPNRWLEGVTWQPLDCLGISTTAPEPCEDDLFGETWTIDCTEWGTATPFRIQQAFQGSTLNFNDPQWVAERLQSNYERTVSAAFGQRLTVALGAVATAPEQGQAFADAAISVEDAIGVLESTIADRLNGGVGYIHIPPLLLGRAVVTSGLQIVDGHFETPAGNIVISDAGYDQATAPTGGGRADMTDWIWSSGEIFYAKTLPDVFDPTYNDETTDESPTAWQRNQYEQWISGYGLLVFDACAVSGVNATLVAA
jgi:hypothetical protein